MNYLQFVNDKPVLFGQITVNGKSKIGQFKTGWNSFDNSLCYQYYSPSGKKGKGGFTLKRAFSLFEAGQLSTNPENGNPDNYL